MLKRDVILTHVTHVLLAAGVAEPCQLYLQRIQMSFKKETRRRKYTKKERKRWFPMLRAKLCGSISLQEAALVPDTAWCIFFGNKKSTDQGNLAVIRDKYCQVTWCISLSFISGISGYDSIQFANQNLPGHSLLNLGKKHLRTTASRIVLQSRCYATRTVA